MTSKQSIKFYNLGVFLSTFIIEKKFKAKVIGKENIPTNIPFIFAGNHTSFYDIPLLAVSSKSNIHFMAKKELFEKKLINYILTKWGAFKVDRDNNDQEAVKYAIELLKEGNIVGIYPEGTRNKELIKNNEINLLPFQKGTVYIAKKANVPIVPFGISGEYKKNKITINFGKPIYLNKTSIKKGTTELEEHVKKLVLK